MIHDGFVRLKADMHIHSREDPQDSWLIKYNAYELTDRLYDDGYSVFSLTLHNHMLSDEDMGKLQDYAKERGMVFYKGVERSIEKKHILIYEADAEDVMKVKTFSGLRDLGIKYRCKDPPREIMCIASHPFYPEKNCIGEDLWMERRHLHGIELSGFETKIRASGKFNRKAKERSRMHNMVLMGNSDAHFMYQIGSAYSNIYVPRDALRDVNWREWKDKPFETLDDFRETVRESSIESYAKLKKHIMHYMKKRDNVQAVSNPMKVSDYLAHTLRVLRLI